MILTHALENSSSFQFRSFPTESLGIAAVVAVVQPRGDAINAAGTSKLAGQGCVCARPLTLCQPVWGNAQLFPLIKGFPRLKVYFVFEESELRLETTSAA